MILKVFIDVVKQVTASWVRDPKKSIAERANDLGLSKSMVQRSLKQQGVKPFRPTKVQELSEQDKLNRMQFSRIFLQRIRDFPGLKDFVIWTDECVFRMNGHSNRRNMITYDYDNPHELLEIPHKTDSQHVWAGVCARGIIGPFFLHGNVNQFTYRVLLEENVVPAIIELYPEDIENVYFQQDGAPAHFALGVRQYLGEVFGDRWIGRGGPDMVWPPRSPDLTPPDFFLWGMLKDYVYKDPRPRDMPTLREKIIAGCQNIPLEMVQRVCDSAPERFRKSLNNDGNVVTKFMV